MSVHYFQYYVDQDKRLCGEAIERSETKTKGNMEIGRKRELATSTALEEKGQFRLEMFNIGLLLVIDRTGILGDRIVSISSFVVHVFREDLFTELVRVED